MDWVSAVVQGVLGGGFFALLAAGLSFMFGVMRIVNLAHGTLVVLGAYLGLWIMTVTGVPWWIAVFVLVPVFGAVGWMLQIVVLNPSLTRGGLAPIIVTFGLAVIIASLLQETFSANQQSIRSDGLGSLSVTVVPGMSVGVLQVLTFVVAVLVILGLQLFLGHTRYGRAMRATSDDQVTAQLMGIDNRRIYALATAIALGTIAIAGMFLGMRTQFSPFSGNDMLIFAFEAVIIGGLGSIWGTLAGGIILGLAQALGNQVWSGYGVLVAHLLFLVILAVRPAGLFRKVVIA